MNYLRLIVTLVSVMLLANLHLVGQKSDKLEALTEELEMARRTNDYDDLALSYYNLALYDEEANRNLEESFEHLSRSLEYYELARDTAGTNRAKYHIARQLLGNDMYEDAYNRILELKTYFQEKQNPKMQAYVDLLLFDYHIEKLEVEIARATLDEVKEMSIVQEQSCLLYTSPSPRDKRQSRMPSSA